jgi:hypothetical protein
MAEEALCGWAGVGHNPGTRKQTSEAFGAKRFLAEHSQSNEQDSGRKR